MFSAAESILAQAGELAVTFAFNFVGAIIIIVVGYTVAGLLERWTRTGLRRFPAFDETLQRFLSKLVRYTILVLVAVTVLAQFGVQTASIIAALGAAGLAIGLALQGTLQNIAAGIMLLVLKPFKVGEYIDAGGIAGTVEEIGLFATELKSADGVFVLSPNSELWNRAVTNYSRNATRRNDIAIRIGYGDDIDLAQSIMLKLAMADERALSLPAPETFVWELSESAIIVTLRYWTTTSDFWQTRFDLTRAVTQALEQSGITIALPQRVVHFIPGQGENGVPEQAG